MALSIAGAESYRGIVKPHAIKRFLRRAIENWRDNHGSFRYVHPDEFAHPESRALTARLTPHPIYQERTSSGAETAQPSFFEQSVAEFIHASDLELKFMQAQASVDNPEMQMLAFTLRSPYPHRVDQFYLLRDGKERFHFVHRAAYENDSYLDLTFFGNKPVLVKKDDTRLAYNADKSHVDVREVPNDKFSSREQKLMQIAFNRLPTVHFLNHPEEVGKWRTPQRSTHSLLLSDGDPYGVLDLLHHPSGDFPTDASVHSARAISESSPATLYSSEPTSPEDRFSARSLVDENDMPQWLQPLITGDAHSLESPSSPAAQNVIRVAERSRLPSTTQQTDTIARIAPPQRSSQHLLGLPPELAKIFGSSENSGVGDGDFSWQQDPELVGAGFAYVKHPTRPPQHHTYAGYNASLQQRETPTSFPSNFSGWESNSRGDVSPDFSVTHPKTPSLDSYKRVEFRDGARHVTSYRKPGSNDRYIGLAARELVDIDEIGPDGRTIGDILLERLVRDGADYPAKHQVRYVPSTTDSLPLPTLLQRISTPKQSLTATFVPQRQSSDTQSKGKRTTKVDTRQPHTPLAGPVTLFSIDISDFAHSLAFQEQPANVAPYVQSVRTTRRTLGEVHGITTPRKNSRIGMV